MSYWTYINGTITVSPMGRTQAEKRYILDTVLNHLPNVTGSECDMHIEVIEEKGFSSSSSHDEYGQMTDNLIDRYGQRNRNGWLEVNDNYIIVVYGSFRDRMFDQTYKEFQNWLCRLSKRVQTMNVLVNIKGWKKSATINESGYNNPYYRMFEYPSWCSDIKDNKLNIESINWCEHLMWHRAPNSSFPDLLEYKYFNDEENDKKVEEYYFKDI